MNKRRSRFAPAVSVENEILESRVVLSGGAHRIAADVGSLTRRDLGHENVDNPSDERPFVYLQANGGSPTSITADPGTSSPTAHGGNRMTEPRNRHIEAHWLP